MKVLVADNDDSFTFNLVQLLEQSGLCDFLVEKSARITLEKAGHFDKILISPGPGLPDDFPVLKEMILSYGSCKSILGICLGHQAIAEAFGAALENMRLVKHGIAAKNRINDPVHYLFSGVPDFFSGGLYHSWRVSPAGFPDALRVTATDGEGNIMAITHRNFDIAGIQFHPESVMTPTGNAIIRNWLRGDAVSPPY
ncbi:MAG: aminodeoxychorismate/anthranilate synthase component II [Bacteroidales bacterium]|nr:aminodeoxychorismate/anthranilate synthase component II [Bacteroidales bacterium]